ncbi:MAG: DNA primase, partial [Clostridia bacterium]|nr:DNA primase [Clostridia bacterium]
MIDHKIIEEIKFRNNIEDVISSYVTLKRAGSNMNGLCPFHSEKTPSFTVFTSSQNFYCFGCGAGGDVITFIMRAENLEYPDAVEFLAKRVGIEIPKDNEPVSRGPSRTRIIDMNRDAARFFHSQLYTEAGKVGLEYLRNSRQLSDSVIKRFGLGFAPDSFGALTDHLRSKGYTEEELLSGFMCGKGKKNGRLYDYFRGRVMFPIIDVAGNVIAFGGRVMDDSVPKYLNSSDTPAFKKSRNLFALNYAKNNAEEHIILCEGYMDVIALHAAGFSSAVATLGTAITSEQARIISKYTKKVIISYDSDAAGQRAADKAIKLLTEAGCEVKVLKMNGAKDPDEYIKKFGAAKFKELLSGSRGRFDFKVDSVLAAHDITLPDEKIKASEELCKIAAEAYSEAEREVYIGRIAEVLSLPRESIRADVRRQVSRRTRERKKNETRNAYLSGTGYGDRVNPDFVKNVHAARAEETVLGLLLSFDEHRKFFADGGLELGEDDFVTELGKRIFTALRDGTDATGAFDLSLYGDRFNVEEMGRITRMRVSREQLTVNDRGVLLDAVKVLKNESSAKSSSDDVSYDDLMSLINKKKNEK